MTMTTSPSVSFGTRLMPEGRVLRGRRAKPSRQTSPPVILGHGDSILRRPGYQTVLPGSDLAKAQDAEIANFECRVPGGRKTKNSLRTVPVVDLTVDKASSPEKPKKRKMSEGEGDASGNESETRLHGAGRDSKRRQMSSADQRSTIPQLQMPSLPQPRLPVPPDLAAPVSPPIPGQASLPGLRSQRRVSPFSQSPKPREAKGGNGQSSPTISTVQDTHKRSPRQRNKTSATPQVNMSSSAAAGSKGGQMGDLTARITDLEARLPQLKSEFRSRAFELSSLEQHMSELSKLVTANLPEPSRERTLSPDYDNDNAFQAALARQKKELDIRDSDVPKLGEVMKRHYKRSFIEQVDNDEDFTKQKMALIEQMFENAPEDHEELRRINRAFKAERQRLRNGRLQVKYIQAARQTD